MADLSALNYDPAKTEDVGEGGFRVIPPGIYNVIISNSELKDNRAGNGKYLEVTYQIIEGREFIGKTVKDRLNIIHTDPKTQKFAHSQLKKICDAVGHKGQLKDSNQLHGKPMSIRVVIEEFESNKEPGKILQSNRVESRMPKQSAITVAPPSAESGQEQPLPW